MPFEKAYLGLDQEFQNSKTESKTLIRLVKKRARTLIGIGIFVKFLCASD
jgi:hypothetical protein